MQDRVGSGVDAVDLRRVAGGFCVLVGIMMGTVWGVLFAIGQVPEINTVPIELGFLLVAEFLTAGSLVLGGLGLVLRKSWAYRAYLAATGLLLYSITNYLGGLIQRGELAMAAFIGVMGVLTVVFFIITLPKKAAHAEIAGAA